jgi:hypothetical protein
MVDYTLNIGFYEGDASQPTDEDIKALMSQVSSFLKMRLQSSLGPLTELAVQNLTWQYTEDAETPLTLHFDISATYLDGSSVAPDMEYEALKLGSSDLTNLIQNYIWNSRSESGESIFVNVNELSIDGYTGSASEGCENVPPSGPPVGKFSPLVHIHLFHPSIEPFLTLS